MPVAFSRAGLAVLASTLTFLAASAAQAEQAAAPASAPDISKCVTDEARFVETGGTPTFAITLTNSCALRIRCTVNAYIVTAMGPSTGQKVLTLPVAGPGQPTQASYVMKIKQASGSANTSRTCAAL